MSKKSYKAFRWGIDNDPKWFELCVGHAGLFMTRSAGGRNLMVIHGTEVERVEVGDYIVKNGKKSAMVIKKELFERIFIKDETN